MSSTTGSSSSTTTSSSPTSTTTDSSPGTTSNSLYLFTFLTTLLLLLGVSCGIVLRSFILRRRFRRRVEAAIAAGVLLPEQVEALRRRGPALGERPTLWEVRIGKGGANAAVDGLHKPGYEAPAARGIDAEDDDIDDWAKVMPVSAAIIPASKKGTASSSQPAPIPISRTMGDPEDLLTSSRRPRWLRLGHRNDSAQILPMTGIPPPPDRLPATSGQPEGEPSNLGTTPSTPTPEALDKLQLTVLITMPNSSNRHYHPSMSQADDTSSIDFDDDKKPAVAPHAPRGPEISTIDADDDDDEEEEIPEVVFGITEVLWDAGLDWKPQPPKVEGGEDRA